MTTQEIHTTITGFVDLIDNGSANIGENESTLSLRLDQLALISHSLNIGTDGEIHDVEHTVDSTELRAVISARFPYFGYYNSPNEISVNISGTEIAVSDAIDDILDITLELKKVLWLWSNTTSDIALSYYSESFNAHWAMHLRELQLFILAIKNAA